MNTKIFKSILMGVAIGALFYFLAPFIFIILLLKFIFTPFGMARMSMFSHRKYRYGRPGFGPRFEMADRIRNMNDDEYLSFKEKWGRNGGCHY